jgi:hypothetical protein
MTAASRRVLMLKQSGYNIYFLKADIKKLTFYCLQRLHRLRNLFLQKETVKVCVVIPMQKSPC